MYEKACSADFATACYNLGLIYADGILVKQDFAKAKELYEKSCAGDEGCTNLGLLYANGAGVQQDYAKAAEFYKKA